MSSTQFHISDALQRGAEVGMRRGMELAMTSVIDEIVAKLSETYGFDAEEAIDFLGAVTIKKSKPKQIQLPWCGKVKSDCCQSLKFNKGLFSQCLATNEEGGEFCKRCQKDADKNGGVPVHGTALERLNDEAGFVEKKGKKMEHYGNYLKKEGITRVEAEAEASKHGIEIPDEYFKVFEKKKKQKKEKECVSENTITDEEQETSTDEEQETSTDEEQETSTDEEQQAMGDEDVDAPEQKKQEQQEQQEQKQKQKQQEQKQKQQEQQEQEQQKQEQKQEQEQQKEQKQEQQKEQKKKVSRRPKDYDGGNEEWKALTEEEKQAWKNEKKAKAKAEKKAEKEKQKQAKAKAGEKKELKILKTQL